MPAANGISGDRALAMETVKDGLVFRVSAFVDATGGKGNAFDRQAAVIEYMINNLQIGK